MIINNRKIINSLFFECRSVVWNQLQPNRNPSRGRNLRWHPVAMDGQPWTLLTFLRTKPKPEPEPEPEPEVGSQVRSNPDRSWICSDGCSLCDAHEISQTQVRQICLIHIFGRIAKTNLSLLTLHSISKPNLT
jgi:hypothetical protein